MSLDLYAWQMASKSSDTVMAMIRFINGSHAHESSRCQLVAAFLLTLWQLSGPAFSPTAPSFILVDANGHDRDPVWSTLSRLLPTQLDALPPRDNHPVGTVMGHEVNPHRGDPELSRRTMLATRIWRREVNGQPPAIVQARVAQLQMAYRQARSELFPAWEINRYHNAFDQDFGLVTRADDHISLLVDQPEALKLLMKHLADSAGPLVDPTGMDDGLEMGPKNPSIMGVINPGDWQEELVRGLWRRSIPTLYLPHVSPAVLEVQAAPEMEALIRTFTRHHRTAGQRRQDLLRNPLGGIFGRYVAAIHRLAARLPLHYQFSLQLIIRQLGDVVSSLCQWLDAGREKSVTAFERLHRLGHDLYVAALRGIAYGVASFGYLGYGIRSTREDRQLVTRLLEHLRAEGAVSKRDLQRGKLYTLTAQERDELLADLEVRKLVEVSRRHVTAVPLADHMDGIETRMGFPPLEMITASLVKGEGS
jgi:hypothetical protein